MLIDHDILIEHLTKMMESRQIDRLPRSGYAKAIEDLAGCPTVEPRVMALEEVRQERICWIEDADDGMMTRLFPATMFGTGEYADGSKSYIFLAQKPWAVDVNDYEWWYIIADYEQTWRCWTSRPTNEQREEAPWK